MQNKFDFDVAVIGGGSAGYAAARTAAGAGLKTVIIEGGAQVGGLCILRGCMPTKALLYAAEIKHLAERAQTWGVRAGKVSFDFGRIKRINSMGIALLLRCFKRIKEEKGADLRVTNLNNVNAMLFQMTGIFQLAKSGDET